MVLDYSEADLFYSKLGELAVTDCRSRLILLKTRSVGGDRLQKQTYSILNQESSW